MISDALLKKSVYDVIRKYINPAAVIIWANQAEARPEKPYCSLLFTTGPIQIGDDSEVVDNNQLEYRGIREMNLSVNYYGVEAMRQLGILATALGFNGATEMLIVNGLVAVDSTAPRDLSALLENKFETRAQMDIRFRLLEKAKDPDSGIIEATILENDLDSSSVTIDSTP